MKKEMLKYLKKILILMLPILVLAGCSDDKAIRLFFQQKTAEDTYYLPASVMNEIYNDKQTIVLNQVITEENPFYTQARLNKELADNTFLFIGKAEKLMIARGYNLISTDTNTLGKGNYITITLVFEKDYVITSPQYG